jgi:YVTN family beta-propeller protein
MKRIEEERMGTGQFLPAKGWPILGLIVLGLLSTGLPSALAKLPANQLVATVTVGSEPFAVVVSADSSTVYVVNGSQSVSVINAATNQVTATITGLGNNPYLAALTPDGSTLYVTNNLSPYISVISTATNAVTTTIPVQEGAQGLVVSPDGSTLYGAVASYGQVYVVSTASNSVTGVIDTTSFPTNLAITPDGSTVVVYNDQIAGPAVLQFIDTATETLSSKVVASAKIAYGGMKIDPTGTNLYISDGDNYVTEVEAATGKVKEDFLAIASPFDRTTISTPVVTPSLAYLYVANYVGNHGTDDQVLMVDLADHKVKGTPVTIGLGPHDLAIAPNGNTLYVTNQQTGTLSVINIQVP